MYREKIIQLPNVHLRQRSQKVGVVNDTIKKLAHDMEAAVLEWEASREHEVGVALAAIQIDEPLRVIVIRNDIDNKEDKTFSVFINPVITKYEGEIQEDFEGCLSVKDIYGKVPRYSNIRLSAQNLAGKQVRLRAEGFLARTLQHEVDHTNGTVFVDHIKDKTQAFFELTADGKLEPLDYEKHVRKSRILW